MFIGISIINQAQCLVILGWKSPILLPLIEFTYSILKISSDITMSSVVTLLITKSQIKIDCL